MRPVEIDADGRPRFKANALVRLLLDADGHTRRVFLGRLEDLAAAGAVPQADVDEFFQLIGYSVGGYGELAHVSRASAAAADAEAARVLRESGRG
jgi:hypothetical protein